MPSEVLVCPQRTLYALRGTLYVLKRTWGETFLRVWYPKWGPGKDAHRSHGQNPAARIQNGAIWCKLRPKSILTEAHFWPQGSSGSWLGYDMILGSIFGANVPKCMERCSKSSLSEFTSGPADPPEMVRGSGSEFREA